MAVNSFLVPRGSSRDGKFFRVELKRSMLGLAQLGERRFWDSKVCAKAAGKDGTHDEEVQPHRNLGVCDMKPVWKDVT